MEQTAAKKTKKKGRGRKVLMVLSAILLVLSLVANYVMNYFGYIMNQYLGSAKITVSQAEGTDSWDTDYYGKNDGTTEDEAATHTREVAQKVAEEGYVLLKNDNNTLPLKDTTQLSAFGWAFSYPVYGGTGSGSGDSSTSISPQQGLEDAGFSVNPDLLQTYASWSSDNGLSARPGTNTDFSAGQYWTLPEMPLSDSDVSQAAQYSDTAIVWIARQGGEGQDEALNMDASLNGTTDVQMGYSKTKHYLELTDAEESMISAIEADEDIRNIIVVINSSNAMELGELENDPRIGAVLLVPSGGSTGFEAVGEILRGTVNPSGRNTDTYYANFKLDPTYQNFGDPSLYETSGPSVNYYGDENRFANSQEGDTYTYTTFVQYEEGIYLGYRYYETAYDLLYEQSGKDAADAWYYGWQKEEPVTVGSETGDSDTGVVYPFGYGLSYTTFDWQVTDSSLDVGTDGTISVTVQVTNTGDVAGKDVVELYYTAPYIEGGAEKATEVLGDYKKTDMIEPGASATVTLTLPVENMASYNDKFSNPDGTDGSYVLDAGDYTLSLRTDAHTPKEGVDTLTYTVNSEVDYNTDDTKRSTDNIAAKNVFDDNLSERSTAMVDFSRSDWGTKTGEGSFPTQATDEDRVMSDALKAKLEGQTSGGISMTTGSATMTGTFDPSTYDNADDVMPTTGADVTLQLIDLRGKDYDDPAWDTFMDELTVDEMENIICGGSFATTGIDRLGIPASSDNDGPQAIKWSGSTGNQTAEATGGSSQAMPSEVVLACTFNPDLIREVGEAIGEEGLLHNVSGWYAPGLDTHRSPFGGRNFEYFSEDPYLAGTICAAEVSGVGSKGIYAYVKHFVLNDQETYRNTDAIGNWNSIKATWRFMDSTDEVIQLVWAREQAIREIYARAFEIVVKTATCEEKYISDSNGTVETKTVPATTAIMSGFDYIGDTWCGANGNLLNTMLRDEWGFQGTVITDAAAYPYMSQDHMIYEGGDLLLAIGQNNLMDAIKTSATGVTAMRRAAKNNLYTKTNSNAMNGIAPGSIITTGLAPWQIGCYIFIAAAVAFFAIVWGLWIRDLVRSRKSKTQKN